MRKEDKRQEELMKKYPNGISLQDQVYEFEDKWKKDNIKQLLFNIFNSFMVLSFVFIFVYSIYDWNLLSIENSETFFILIMMGFVSGLFFLLFIFIIYFSIIDFKQNIQLRKAMKQLAKIRNKKV